MSRTRSRAAVPDPACAAAVDLARAAVEENVRPEHVGEHLAAEAEGDRVVTHYFACLDRAYRGWRWAVTVARAARARNVTVSEVVLLPGAGALLPPEWVPWSERLRPGDLGVGDLLPTPDDDDRLAPGFTETDDETDRQMIFEYGLGRARVLSRIGRDRAVRRWHAGESGPHTPLAHAAPPSAPPAVSTGRSRVRCASASVSAPTSTPPTTGGSSRPTTVAARTPRPPCCRTRSSRRRRSSTTSSTTPPRPSPT